MAKKTNRTRADEGMRALRARLDEAAIPKSRPGRSLNVAAWNIRRLGRKPRRPESIEMLAEIVGRFDLVVVEELQENVLELELLLTALGTSWRGLYSDRWKIGKGRLERLGILYNHKRVRHEGLAGEADTSGARPPDGAERLWVRPPYLTSWQAARADHYRFVICVAQLRWPAARARQGEPVRALGAWLRERRMEPHLSTRDLLVVGDLRIPELTKKERQPLTRRRVRIPSFFDARPAAVAGKARYYDQILHLAADPRSFTDRAGCVDFVGGDHRPLFPGTKMDQFAFADELSDHGPVWIQLRTDRLDR